MHRGSTGAESVQDEVPYLDEEEQQGGVTVHAQASALSRLQALLLELSHYFVIAC